MSSTVSGIFTILQCQCHLSIFIFQIHVHLYVLLLGEYDKLSKMQVTSLTNTFVDLKLMR